MANDESIEKIKAAVGKLIKVEEEVIDLTDKIINKAENVTVRYLLKAIQHDSRKHADFGQAAMEILDFKTIVGAQERKEVWDLIKKHDDMEKKHREFVAEIKSLTKTPALQYIFKHIMDDEKRHHAILETLMTKRFEKDPVAQWGALLNYYD